jgi:hypothetical protein
MLLHVWDGTAAGDILELLLVGISTAGVLALHVALLRMFPDSGRSTRDLPRDDSELRRRELRAVRRGRLTRNGGLLNQHDEIA